MPEGRSCSSSARGTSARLVLPALLGLLVGCASPWGGASLHGPVADGVYAHPSGRFSVWAPYCDADDVHDAREWEWLYHEEGGDEQGFAYTTFGPAFLDVSVFGVSVRPVDLFADPRPVDAFDRLCSAHNSVHLGSARMLHDELLEIGGVETLFRLYHYARHARWTSAGAGEVSGNVLYYLQRRGDDDVFVMLDVPDNLEDSEVPISAGTLIDQAWDKQRRFVASVRVPAGGHAR